MSVMTSFTLRSLAKNRVRTAVSVIGIALSCALITAIFTTVASLNAGLYLRTLQSEGAWQLYSTGVSADSLTKLEESDRVADLAVSEELGSAAFSSARQDQFGGYLTVKTTPTVCKGAFEVDGVPLTLMPAVEEGRMPETSDEIVLPTMLKGETLGGDGSGVAGENIQVGSTVTLDLGERVKPNAETGENMRLDSSDSYTDPASAKEMGLPPERLANTASRTYTVVGFYNELGRYAGNDFAATGAGLTGITAPADDEAPALSDPAAADGPSPVVHAWATTRGFSSTFQMEDFADAMGLNDVLLHSNLLRYQGITDGRAVYDSIAVLAATLAAVVAIASVSLIYNAFAISVAERTRQFGVLSSVGASKTQLRRSVLFEALVLGAAGIPLGVLLGIAGVAVTLHFTADALGNAIAIDGGIPFTVSPAAIAGCVAFSAITLLASAWVPAMRASRVSAVEAIRQTQDVRLTRRALRRQRRSGVGARTDGASAAPFSCGTGLIGRIFGVPGVLARRSRERASSRGRTVTASLAISVMLLIVCGSVKLYMDPFVDRAQGTPAAGNEADITVTFNRAEDTQFSMDAEDLQELVSTIDSFAHDAAQEDGVELAGIVKQGQADAVVPADMLDPQGRTLYDSKYESDTDDWVPSAFTAQGDYVRGVTTFYLDDAAFDALAESAGVDPSEFDDPAHPKALGLDSYRGQTKDGRYIDMDGICRNGTITLYDLASLYDGNDAWGPWGLAEDQDGTLQMLWLNTQTNETQLRPLPDDIPTLDVEVVGVTKQMSSSLYSISAESHYPVLIMPQSVCDNAAANGLKDLLGFTFANALFNAEDHTQAFDALSGLAAGFESDSLRINVFDNAGSGESMRMLAQAIQLFVLLFSLITALVAVANVFNTLTNSIILRTREFAVLKSVGMGGRAFAKMLVCECAGFAAKGFLIGFALAAVATYAIYYGSSFSFASLAFTMPWAYVAAALAVTLAVLALSVAFALRKSRASSIVEALRAEAM